MNELVERISGAIEECGPLDMANYQHRELVARIAIEAVQATAYQQAADDLARKMPSMEFIFARRKDE